MLGQCYIVRAIVRARPVLYCESNMTRARSMLRDESNNIRVRSVLRDPSLVIIWKSTVDKIGIRL